MLYVLHASFAAGCDSRLSFELFGISSDKDIAALDFQLQAQKAVKSWSVFDIAILGVETGSVPGADDAAVSGQDTIGEWGAIMSALG